MLTNKNIIPRVEVAIKDKTLSRKELTAKLFLLAPSLLPR